MVIGLFCCVRDKGRMEVPSIMKDQVEIVECDLLDKDSLKNIPKDIDAAYYLVHSMSSSNEFEKLELEAARNFKEAIGSTHAKQVIYLSGLSNESELSKHLESRRKVEEQLQSDDYALTVLRAGIIIGSGSASFEIIRDLVEKLPVMVTPKWLSTKCQPIGISDVLNYLQGVLLNEKTYNDVFDIGGPDVLTYKRNASSVCFGEKTQEDYLGGACYDA